MFAATPPISLDAAYDALTEDVWATAYAALPFVTLIGAILVVRWAFRTFTHDSEPD